MAESWNLNARTFTADRRTSSIGRSAPAVVAAVALLIAGCSGALDRTRLTYQSADGAGVRISNSPLIADHMDRNQRNLLLAAESEGYTVMSAERQDGRSDSIYEWNELVLRFETETSGFAPEQIGECWRFLFEGNVVRSGPLSAECPDGEPLQIEPPPTAPPTTQDPVLGAQLEALKSELSMTFEALPKAPLGAAALESHLREALGQFDVLALDAAVVDGIAAAAVRTEYWCIFARSTGFVEVWVPVFGNAIDTCTSARAAEGGP